MKKLSILCLMAALYLHCQAFAQGIADFGASHALPAGLGAGLAASLSHGKAIKHSYESVVKAQQNAMAQTKAIQQYMQLGCQLEAKKRWAEAESSFKYVLQVVARRDGPGSKNSVPALEHLVSVTKAQNKLNDAIGFQETVVAFKKATSTVNPNAVVNSQLRLSSLLIENNNYQKAEPVLQQTIAQCDSHPADVPKQQRHDARVMYIGVLKKLHKNDEAKSLEADIDQETKVDDNKIIDKTAADKASVEKSQSENTEQK